MNTLLDAATLDAHYSLAMLAMQGGAPIHSVIEQVQAEWNGGILISKAELPPGGPGDHGIPEIGTEERSFYDALTDAERDTYRAIKTLIEENHGSPGWNPWSVDDAIDTWKKLALQGTMTNAMRAYLVGQMLAGSKIDDPTHGPLKPLDYRNIQHLQDYAFNEISSTFDDLKATLRRRLIEGEQLGQNPKKIARLIENELKDYKTNWELIAITETARAESQGRLQEFHDEEITQAIGSTAHDSRVCAKCKELIEGQIVDVADTIGRSNYGKKQAEWVACIPLHPRCRCVWLPYIHGVTTVITGEPVFVSGHA